MVIRSCGIRIACDQLAAADVTGNAKGVLFSYHLSVLIENELNQAAVFFHLMAQPFGIVAVYLDVAVKGLHLCGAVEGIVAVPGLIVRQQVACMVIAEEGSGTVFGVGRQVCRVSLCECGCRLCRRTVLQYNRGTAPFAAGSAGRSGKVFHLQAVVCGYGCRCRRRGNGYWPGWRCRTGQKVRSGSCPGRTGTV